MKSKFWHWLSAGGLLLAILASVPPSARAGTEREENDDATARRQAMDEWYNESYAERGRRGFGHGGKKSLWTPQYERFMLDAAKRERDRYAKLMPKSGTSDPVIDSLAPAIVSG